jgi:antitoxin ParD1/3/4
MPTRNVKLTDHFDQFIEEGVNSGKFLDASAVVHEGLRLLEQREAEQRARLEWLRSAVQEGIEDIERGDYSTLRSVEEIDEFLRQVDREVSTESVTQQSRG